jgi:predicted  nucleic acid-binding Zn-ribbon protein
MASYSAISIFTEGAQAKLNQQIKAAGRSLEESDHQSSTILPVQSEIAEKVSRLERLKKEFTQAGYDSRIAAYNVQFKNLEESRDQLNNEFAQLSLQADCRAKLSIRTQEQSRKVVEISNTYVGFQKHPAKRHLSSSGSKPPRLSLDGGPI